jgi:ABC-type amino acid transport substrate-binding protein
MKRPDGSYDGISITLWRDIAHRLDIQYRFKQTDLNGLLDGVENGSLDVGVGALTVTAERAAKLNFTQPFYITGLGIAVRPQGGGSGWLEVVTRFFSWQFLVVVLSLAGLLLAAGLFLWLFEHKKNPEMFGGYKGIGTSFWWAAVTMTTVGYGDTAPVTLGGRLVGLVWMFAALIVVSSFTASITSSLTIGRLGGQVHGPGDLSRVGLRVATVAESTSAEYLRNHRIRYRTYRSVKAAVEALVQHRVGAVVYDAPTLKYIVNKQYHDKAAVLPNTFNEQEYAFALHLNSGLRKSINVALLKIIHGPSWQDVLYRYLGQPK